MPAMNTLREKSHPKGFNLEDMIEKIPETSTENAEKKDLIINPPFRRVTVTETLGRPLKRAISDMTICAKSRRSF